MASSTATLAATARAAEAGDARLAPCPPGELTPFLSGGRALGAGILVVGVAGLLLAPAVVAFGSWLYPGAAAGVAAWLERLTLAAPAILAARALVAVVAVVAIARSDGQG